MKCLVRGSSTALVFLWPGCCFSDCVAAFNYFCARPASGAAHTSMPWTFSFMWSSLVVFPSFLFFQQYPSFLYFTFFLL